MNFEPAKPSIGPYPTDALTVTNTAQKTGLNINLPKPDCAAQPSDCGLIGQLNELDGFHLSPRIRLNFSGAIAPDTLRTGVFFVALENLTSEEPGVASRGQLTTLNQVVYDPETNTAYAKPDESLDQHRRYALVVTDAVLTAAGNPVEADARYTACIESPASDYCSRLKAAVAQLSTAALPGKIVGVSVFTTLSATAWMEKARDLLARVPANYQPNSVQVKAGNVTTIELNAQITVSPATFRSLRLAIPPGTMDGVDRIVFGTYQSPNFLNTQQFIPATPTGTALPLPAASNTIQLHAYIPDSPMPQAGYPVVIFGHGFGSNGFVTPTLIASTLAKAGYATVAINMPGHGYGPQSTVNMIESGGVSNSFPGAGRGVDLNSDGTIDSSEGCFLAWPVPVGSRDCLRQSAVDVMQLVSTLRGIAALDAAGTIKLDGNRLYYAGASLGGMYGTLLHSLDPRIRASAFSVGGGSIVDIARWAPAYHSYAVQWVGGARTPSLLNAGADYNENFVLRNQPVKTNTVAGAMEIQNLFGDLEWVQASGDSLSFAPHLRLAPLPGVPARPALFMYGLGDQSVPNPLNSALIRTAGMFDSSTLYRADLAEPLSERVCCMLAADSHSFLADNTSPAALLISKAAQQQMAGFFASEGRTIPDASEIYKKSLPFASDINIFETPARNIEPLNFGRLGISRQQDLTLDTTPAIRNIASATGTPASLQPSIQAGSWVAIHGSNLSDGTADWSGLITGNKLPESIANVGVTIGGKPAFVYFISPSQINVLAPDIPVGSAEVIVNRNGTRTAPVKVQVNSAAPAFFQWGQYPYALATRYPDGAYVAKPSVGAGFVSAKPGDVLILWATGFGPTNPAQPIGTLSSDARTVVQPVKVTVGGAEAQVIGTALSPGLAGVYQIAVQLPASLPAGEAALKATVSGLNTPDSVTLFIEP